MTIHNCPYCRCWPPYFWPVMTTAAATTATAPVAGPVWIDPAASPVRYWEADQAALEVAA